ncbi:hypothetical protein YC2023_040076 [Brassica napus]
MEENDPEIQLSPNSKTENQKLSQCSTRKKQDLAWEHVTHTLDPKGKSIFSCAFVASLAVYDLDDGEGSLKFMCLQVRKEMSAWIKRDNAYSNVNPNI